MSKDKENDSPEASLPRRSFLKNSLVVPSVIAGAGASTIVGAQSVNQLTDQPDLSFVPIDRGEVRPWLGRQFWANSLQDWELRDGSLVCIARNAIVGAGKTASLLTRELNRLAASATIRARFTRIPSSGDSGFVGFLFGTGEGALDYRAAALGQSSGGQAGGIVAVMEANGRLQFLEHGDEENIFGLKPLLKQTFGNVGLNEPVVILELRIETQSNGDFSATLLAANEDGTVIDTAQVNDLSPDRVVGGISLASLPRDGIGARWAINEIATAGQKVTQTPANALGPVIGTLYSLSRGVLRMTAQFMPIAPVGTARIGRARLQYRRDSNQPWTNGPAARISSAYVATFRMDDWDSSVATDFRVVLAGENETLYEGTIRKEPNAGRELSIGLFSCILNSGRQLNANPPKRVHEDENVIGRYTRDNLYFPHNDLTESVTDKNPDILVFSGDQYYESSPVLIDYSSPESQLLSTLYRWYLWYWSFRDLTRDRPSIVLADDHDVLQGNLYGQGGRRAPEGKQNRGGFVRDPKLVRQIFNFQCDHNPDPYDPETIRNKIPVYYSAFVYGGVSFALVEDRKFKTGPNQDSGFDFDKRGRILGRRQVQFLRDWVNIDAGLPKVLLSQTPWATLVTQEDGKPKSSSDSNGFYPRARDTGLRQVKRAGAIMLAGDQHLGTLVRHGLDSFDDGPVQFAGPAGAALFMRWLEPRPALNNQRDGDKNTGDFLDFYGNRTRLLAVANPQITQRRYKKGLLQKSRSLLDRRLKSEGYGIVRVDMQAERFIFECWASNGPFGVGDRQYSGWPYVLNFRDA